jgi:hypothetical protein
MKTTLPSLAASFLRARWRARRARVLGCAGVLAASPGCVSRLIPDGDSCRICFAEQDQELAVSLGLVHVVAGDVSGDANLEVLAVGLRGTAVAAEMWSGSAAGPVGPPIDPMVSGCSAYPVAAPLLASGRDDLVFPACTPGLIAYPGGEAGFGPPVDLDLLVSPRSGVVADMDADGDTDLVVLGGDALGVTALSIIAGGSDGSFAPPSVQPVTGLAFDPSGIGGADFNGDGALDLVVYKGNAPGALGYMLGSGPATFAPAIPLATELAVQTLAIADFDGDGDDDLVYADDDARVVCKWIIDDAPEPAPSCWSLTELVPTDVAAGDLDGDGVAEIVFADATADVLRVWDVETPADDLAMSTLATPAPADLVLLADLQADGELDLVAAHLAARMVSIRLAVP